MFCFIIIIVITLFLMLTKCKNLLWKIYIKIAIPICGMVIKVNNMKKPNPLDFFYKQLVYKQLYSIL